MKKWMTAGILLLIILAGAGAWWSNGKKSHKKDAATSFATAVEGPIEETVEATGDVAPLNRVEIKPPISGRIEKLLVDEGDNVQAGQVLAWMSSSDRAAILDAARSQGPKEYKHWEDAYKPTPIVAPLSGVIILRNVVVGQTVDPSIVLYAMSDKLIVIAQVDEADIGRVHVGMKSRVTLDAYPDTTIQGSVFQILQEGKNVSNVITYGVKIEPAKVPPFFRSQMTANASLIVRRQEKAILVPSAAVREANGGKEVMVPDEQGKPAPQSVETGIENGNQTEIVSGLSVGDKVMVARAKYVPQKAPQNSPLTMGGRPSGNQSSGGGGGRRQ